LPTKKNRLQWSLDREIRRGLVTLIGNRSLEAARDDDDAELNDDKGSNGFRDLLGFMINANDKKKKAAPAIPVEDMLEECKTFFFAGKQTTTNLLTWATVLLAMHPDWQERARQEVLAVCGADELPSKEHLPRLKTVRQLQLQLPVAHFFSFQTKPPNICSPFPRGISVTPQRQKVSLCLCPPSPCCLSLSWG
jgi:PHYB activation tagged suppressor 1